MIKFPSEKLVADYAPIKPIPQYPKVYAHIAEDVFALWDAWEEESCGETDIPFWAVVWPAAISLGHYLLRNKEISIGKTVLDFGCGGGIVGITAAIAGAKKVVGNDIDPVALYIARKNMVANNVQIQFDNRDLLDENNSIEDFDTVLIADMFYEREKSKVLMEFIDSINQKGSEIIIADGQRAFTPKTGFKVLHEEVLQVNESLEGVKERVVRILKLVK